MKNPVLAWAALAVAGLVLSVLTVVCWVMLTDPKSVDFVSFWAAGNMVANGAGAQIYDIEAHAAVENAEVATGAGMPFPYPPPFALFVAPLGMLPYGLAITIWIVLTGTLYVFAARPWMPRRLALAQPAVLLNGLIGQNAFLTSAIFLAGLRLLAARPAAAGAVLGLLIIKPQLALMLPVAMLAGRHWRAIAGGALSACAVLLLGLAALGIESYAAFLEQLSNYAGFMAASRWQWHELASVYAFLRYFGVAAGIAMSVHAIIAAAAAAMVWQAWRQDRPGKEATLAAATLLAPPYLLSYDGILLVLPIAWLLLEAKRPVSAALVWGFSLLMAGSVAAFYELPNTLPLAALLALLAIHGSSRLTSPAISLKAAGAEAR